MNYATVFPTLRYDDAAAAIDFLVEALGAERHAVYPGDDGRVQHAELRWRNGLIMLSSAKGDIPATRGASAYVVVDDSDAHAQRARTAGAEIIREPYDTEYGSRGYTTRDPEGNEWHFGTYQPFAFDHAAQLASKPSADAASRGSSPSS
jgi:uncharacterized glyoxalase superfamily protein PhnB